MAVTKFPTAVLHQDIESNKNRIGKLEGHNELQDDRIRENKDDIEEACKLLNKLQEVVIKSGVAITVGTWIMGAFGLSVIALIWSLITGQAQIVFP